jgi:hypothetical protein
MLSLNSQGVGLGDKITSQTKLRLPKNHVSQTQKRKEILRSGEENNSQRDTIYAAQHY